MNFSNNSNSIANEVIMEPLSVGDVGDVGRIRNSPSSSFDSFDCNAVQDVARKSTRRIGFRNGNAPKVGGGAGRATSTIKGEFTRSDLHSAFSVQEPRRATVGSGPVREQEPILVGPGPGTGPGLGTAVGGSSHSNNSAAPLSNPRRFSGAVLTSPQPPSPAPCPRGTVACGKELILPRGDQHQRRQRRLSDLEKMSVGSASMESLSTAGDTVSSSGKNLVLSTVAMRRNHEPEPQINHTLPANLDSAKPRGRDSIAGKTMMDPPSFKKVGRLSGRATSTISSDLMQSKMQSATATMMEPETKSLTSSSPNSSLEDTKGRRLPEPEYEGDLPCDGSVSNSPSLLSPVSKEKKLLGVGRRRLSTLDGHVSQSLRNIVLDTNEPASSVTQALRRRSDHKDEALSASINEALTSSLRRSSLRRSSLRRSSLENTDTPLPEAQNLDENVGCDTSSKMGTMNRYEEPLVRQTTDDPRRSLEEISLTIQPDGLENSCRSGLTAPTDVENSCRSGLTAPTDDPSSYSSFHSSYYENPHSEVEASAGKIGRPYESLEFSLDLDEEEQLRIALEASTHEITRDTIKEDDYESQLRLALEESANFASQTSLQVDDEDFEEQLHLAMLASEQEPQKVVRVTPGRTDSSDLAEAIRQSTCNSNSQSLPQRGTMVSSRSESADIAEAIRQSTYSTNQPPRRGDLGSVRTESRDLAEAIRLSTHNPSQPQWQGGLGSARTESGDLAEAIRLSTYSTSQPQQRDLVSARSESADIAEAIRLSTHSTNQPQQRGGLLSARAESADLAEAIRLSTHSTNQFPRRENLGMGRTESNDLAEAIRLSTLQNTSLSQQGSLVKRTESADLAEAIRQSSAEIERSESQTLRRQRLMVLNEEDNDDFERALELSRTMKPALSTTGRQASIANLTGFLEDEVDEEANFASKIAKLRTKSKRFGAAPTTEP